MRGGGRSSRSLRSRSGLPPPSVPPPDSLRSPSRFPPFPLPIPSDSRARCARLGFLPPTRRGNPCTPSSGQGIRLRNRLSTSLSPNFPPFPLPLARFARSMPLHAATPLTFRGTRQVSLGATLSTPAKWPHSALIGCRPLFSRLHIVYLLPPCATLTMAAYGLPRARVPVGLEPPCALEYRKYDFALRSPSQWSRLSRGPPPRSRAYSPCPPKGVPALLRPCGRCARYARASRALHARGLRYATADDVIGASGGLPMQSACRGAVALAADGIGNLPPLAIVISHSCPRLRSRMLVGATRPS